MKFKHLKESTGDPLLDAWIELQLRDLAENFEGSQEDYVELRRAVDVDKRFSLCS